MKTKSVYILTDSYGGPRNYGDANDVPIEFTYPYLLKNEFDTFDFIIESASYRRITDLPGMIESQKISNDIFLFQMGIVDAYPRPLNYYRTRSSSFINKLLRKIIRLNRAFFLRYLSNQTWSNISDVSMSLKEVFKILESKKIIFVNISPVNKWQDHLTPGANENIILYNDTIQSICDSFSNVTYLDICEKILSSNDLESLFHPTDSHLNVKGNAFYFEHIKPLLTQLI